MKNYVILTDSCSDLSLDLREKYGIEYVPMSFSYDEKSVSASLDWEEISFHDFYDVMRNGTRIYTAQVNAATYTEAFEKYIAAGYDILSISCSSALSASVKASYTVRDAMLEKYPESKIICIDSLISCGGLGLLCIKASMMRSEGKSIEEVAAWIEENKLKFHQEATVEKLTYLKQAGRVSAASAFFGGLLNVKPIIISDAKGRNVSVEKVKGRTVSFEKLIERTKADIVESDLPIVVSHADTPEDAKTLVEYINAAFPGKEVITMGIGPIVGASVGPGTVSVYYYGTEVTFDAEA